MEDAGCKHGVGSDFHRLGKIREFAGTAAGNQRNAHPLSDLFDHVGVEAARGSIGVHRIQEDFSGTALDTLYRPLEGIYPRTSPTAVRGDLETTRSRRPSRAAASIDAEDDALRAKVGTCPAQEFGICDRGGIQADLVRARAQKSIEILDAADSPTDGKRNEHALCRTTNDLVGGFPTS